jgi:hypothetical protein
MRKLKNYKLNQGKINKESDSNLCIEKQDISPLQLKNKSVFIIYIISILVLFFFTFQVTALSPIFSNPSPANGSTGVDITPSLYVTVNDPEGETMNITFRTNATGTWVNIGSNISVGNGTYYQSGSNMNNYSTKYWWSVNCTDGNSWSNDTYYFTTEDPVISISINQSNYDFTGVKGLNAIYYTNETNPNYFGITNNGEASIDLKIKATNMTCSYSHSWLLSNSNGPNQYVFEYSEDEINWYNISLTDSTIYTNLEIGNNITLDLRLTMPISIDCGHQMGCTVTISAIQH